MATPMLIVPPRFADNRGWFSETYNSRSFSAIGLPDRFVQDNHSLSLQSGTVRGLHFQSPPYAQGKLIRVLRGRILDVAVDIRNGSPTYGNWFAEELSAENGYQLYVPTGYAHGFVTREANTEVMYKVTELYNKKAAGGIIWNDPDIGICWGVKENELILSANDEKLPKLRNLISPFEYDGLPMKLQMISERSFPV